jgi:hypothetical protein
VAHIRTAIEIAMERTQGVKSDRTGAEREEARRAGRVLAAKSLDSPGETDVRKELAAFKKPLDGAAREGAAEAFLSRMQLPRDKTPDSVLEAVASGLASVARSPGSDKRAAAVVKELSGFFARYLEDVSRVEEGLKRQYAPKLRQKEEELARRTGQEVRIDPRRDPEFLALLSKSMGQVKAQYQDALDRAKEELKAIVLD